MKSALYKGEVFHQRRRPSEHVLRYRVFSMLLALDEIDELSEKLWLFSRNRWNLFSFYDKDFGPLAEIISAPKDKALENKAPENKAPENKAEQAKSLEQYVSTQLIDAGINTKPHRILLSCYPRVCGYTFNPLSLFYCLDEEDKPFAILYEVHNTFGERHTYTLSVSEKERQGTSWINQTTDKELFVSPFAHMNMHYKFRLNVPDEKQILVIRVHDEQGHFLTASYTAQRREISASLLLGYFFWFPMMTLKIMFGIHWEALRLWLKKVPWYSHQPKQSSSSHKYKNL